MGTVVEWSKRSHGEGGVGDREGGVIDGEGRCEWWRGGESWRGVVCEIERGGVRTGEERCWRWREAVWEMEMSVVWEMVVGVDLRRDRVINGKSMDLHPPFGDYWIHSLTDGGSTADLLHWFDSRGMPVPLDAQFYVSNFLCRTVWTSGRMKSDVSRLCHHMGSRYQKALGRRDWEKFLVAPYEFNDRK